MKPHWLASREMTMSDAVDEARRVLDIKWALLMYEKYKDCADPAVAELREVLRNLLSHVERPVDAEVEAYAARLESMKQNGDPIPLCQDAAAMLRSLAAERDLANEYVNAASVRVSRAEATVERLTAPVTGDRAELVKTLRGDPRMLWTHERLAAADLLESDARREVALAEAIREIEDLFTRPVTYGGRPWPDGEWLQEHLLAGVLAILGGER